MRIALVGNPNCGKTTLFNALTGSNQYVGNWAGVTVEKKEGSFTYKGVNITAVDLPGIYSLSPYTMEEVIARDFIIDEKPDMVINIVDGTNIERNLYLSIQLMELNVPIVVAINMIDDVKAKGDSIDCGMLSELLGVPVIPITARKNENINAVLNECINPKKQHPIIKYDAKTQTAINDIICVIAGDVKDSLLSFYAGKLLEGDISPNDLSLSSEQALSINDIAEKYESSFVLGDRETLLADARYKYITQLISKSVVKKLNPGGLTLSDKIDRIVTHRILAIPIFMLVMLIMFSLTFGGIGNYLKELTEKFVEMFTFFIERILHSVDAAAWMHSLLIDGIIGGVGGIISFMPQIAILFCFLSFMEDSGYMARAAFIMDRLLRKLGLTGKSFIPMLMGFGCTTPAVMAARTMENDKDRKLTIMLIPFMSCGAKLPIYGLFAGVFFENHQGLVVFSMYILGMLVSVICGLILKNTLFRGDGSAFIMEMPSYRLPSLKSMWLHVWERCKGFLVKAGTIILAMSIVIWILKNFSLNFQMVEDSSKSIFGEIGKLIAPVFAPLGFGTWEASVSVLTGLVAKEAVVSTITVLYGGAMEALAAAFTPAAALSFMVFCLLYMPCVAAFVTVKKELNIKWALGNAAFQTGVAYITSFIVYQIAHILF